MSPTFKAHTGLDWLVRKVIPIGTWLTDFLRGLRLPGSIATAAFFLVAGGVETLDIAGVPKDDWWRAPGLRQDFLLALIVIASALSFVITVSYSLLLGRLSDRERLTAMADGVASLVEQHTPLRRADVGVNIFRIQGPPGFRRLERVARAGESSESPILWTKGKGVIGYVWRTRKPKFADLEELQQLLPDKETFEAIPPDDRFRFTWDDFDDTRQYKAVLAIPIIVTKGARFPVRGVLAISGFTVHDRETLEGIQQVKELRTILNTCRAILGRRRETA